MKNTKTNVMRILERENISYIPHEYDNSVTNGENVAEILGQAKECVFKTLVTENGKRGYFVFVIPVKETLDLKKAAAVSGQKSLSMLKQKDLLPLTGYVHGGCSPVGMKKLFPTFIHESAKDLPAFCVSAGKVGAQVEVSPSEIAGLCGAFFADVIVR